MRWCCPASLVVAVNLGGEQTAMPSEVADLGELGRGWAVGAQQGLLAALGGRERVLETRTKAKFIGITLAQSETRTTFETATGKTRAYESFSRKRGRRYTFGETGYEVVKLRPAEERGAGADWRVTATAEFPYPATGGGGAHVYDLERLLAGDADQGHVAQIDTPEQIQAEAKTVQDELNGVKAEMKPLEEEDRAVNEEFDALMLTVPQPAADEVPVGEDEGPVEWAAWMEAHRPAYRLLDGLSGAQVNAVQTLARKTLGRDGLPATVVTDAQGRSATDEYRVRIREEDLDIRINVAIDDGLWYLHGAQSRGTSGSSLTGSVSRCRVCASTSAAWRTTVWSFRPRSRTGWVGRRSAGRCARRPRSASRTPTPISPWH